jgi:hypothetical protein
MYYWNLFRLWISGKITWPVVRYALTDRPIAVAGKGGSFQVDDRFELGNDPIAQGSQLSAVSARRQFI